MSDNSQSDMFLSLSITYTVGSNVREYVDSVEDAVHQLAEDDESISVIVSSAAPRGDSAWEEIITLQVLSKDLVEGVSERIVRIVRTTDAPSDCNVRLLRQEVSGSRAILHERHLDDGQVTGWRLVKPSDIEAIESDENGHTKLPNRVDYLDALVERYYLVGGRDVYRVFNDDDEVVSFWTGLPESDKTEFTVAYDRIRESNDHKWAMNWLSEDCEGDVSIAKVRLVYFLALLDRIYGSGLIHGTANDELVDWNLFC